jgi:hypothetical protein
MKFNQPKVYAKVLGLTNAPPHPTLSPRWGEREMHGISMR